ncbi:NACHT domain-containing protein [Mycena sanguinolenta]|uniref:NACHT domain-containing protein n=1 Tax=Mycena sanguinolenta TaxID=230812 RepID=A0A8H6WSA5_9AGAR|nr:NACHT domain-containing protein [Mycena sanguinolenta]
MNAERRSTMAKARANDRRTTINISGGRGGHGGNGCENGTGGAGGPGMGPSFNFDISGGSFTMHNAQQDGERGIEILHRAVALEAIHDSIDSFMEPKCHPETRTKMLKDLSDWAVDTHPKTIILWLYGPAGAGKSAIMRTLATQLHDRGSLGACFFFKRGHATRGNARSLFTTIAYQLALNVEWLRAPISQVMERNPSMVARSIVLQMQELIYEPCRSHEHQDPVVILIDGLDECDGHGVQGEVLRAIQHPSSNHPIFLRFIIASRPEPHIRQVLQSSSSHCRSFNVEQSFEDVRKYLRNEFSRIHRDHLTMQNVLSPWPAYHMLEKLVQKSSGYFIYASTIINFIGDEDYHPPQRLAMVQDASNTGSTSPFEVLDQLYLTILGSARRQSELIQIICAIVNFRLVPRSIDQLFGLAQGETRLILRGLHSVLNIPRDAEHEIRSHHASFLDFLNNPGRSGNFCVATFNCRIGLARTLLRFYAGPFQRANGFNLSNLIHFIVSLPPSNFAVAELLPLIGSINTDYIFDPKEYPPPSEDHFRLIVKWLQNSPLAPTDVIQLWEDYAFMFSIDTSQWLPEDLYVKHIVEPSPEILRILLSIGLLYYRLRELPIKLDLTWTNLRTALCSLRPKLVGDEHGVHIAQPQTASPWAARDLALQLIRRMVKNHIDTDGGANPSACRDALLYKDNYLVRSLEQAYTSAQYGFGCNIAYLVRLSPPCLVLYRELWSIPPSEIWSCPSWLTSDDKLIHHVSKWLESFPDPTMELITFWQQAMPDRDSTRKPSPERLERDWHQRVGYYNDAIVKLHLSDSCKIIL